MTETAASQPVGGAAGWLRSCRRRAAVAGALGERRHQRGRPVRRRAPVLRADDVPVPVGGGAARRQPLRVHGQRHLWTIPAAAGAHGLRAARATTRSASTRRTSRSRSGVHPMRADSAEHRQLPAAAEARRADGRLAPRAVDDGPARTTSGRSGSSCSCYKQGLAYKKKAAVNWCPTDKTVLANEQVDRAARASGAARRSSSGSWSSGSSGSRDYAGRLLTNLDRLDWSESTQDGAAELDRQVRGRGDRLHACRT